MVLIDEALGPNPTGYCLNGQYFTTSQHNYANIIGKFIPTQPTYTKVAFRHSMSNIVNVLQLAAMDNQDTTAIDADPELSFSRLWSLTDRFAGGLRAHEIGKGDSVGICLTDPATLLVAIYGTLRNGSVPVVFSPDLFDSEVADGLDEVGSTALVVDDRSPVSLISLSSSMQFIITVDIDSYFGMSYEEFLDNSGINPSGARTGRNLIERAEDDDAVLTYGPTDGDGAPRTYTHGDLQEAASEAEPSRQKPIVALGPVYEEIQPDSASLSPNPC